VRRLKLFVLGLAAVWALAAPPSPESYFGHRMGADRTVLDWPRVVSYFEALEKSSDRIRVHRIGLSAEGRPLIAAFIAAPETLRHLDRYAWIQKKLADPRVTPEAEAEALIGEGKVVVLVTCTVHATEVGSSHTAIEFAHRLLTEDTPRVRAILDNTILLLAPSVNPDGMDLVSAWYRKTLGTPFEGGAPPELYQKYTGHDNNRDWYFFTQPEIRAVVSQLHNVWFPQITYDVHQHGQFASRMFVPPWLDPIEPNIDPIVIQETNMLGAGVAADLTAAGKKGVVVHALYDSWSPSRDYQAYHAGVRLLTESASVRIATPVIVRPGQIEFTAPGYNPRERSWNYLEPWLGGEWRLRDIVDYQLIAMESVLWQAAVRREDLLRNFYRIGRRALDAGPPWAFVVPAAQPDPGAARKLFETLRFGLVEIEQAEGALEANGKTYAPGSWIVRTAQPFGAFAKTLLERQRYPGRREYPGGPFERPYDVTAHTLPLLLGVEVETVASPVPGPLRPATPPVASALRVLPASDSDSWRAINALWAAGQAVWRDSATGDFSAEAAALAHPRRIERPRVGLYRSHQPAIDEGWTRWTLEQSGFAYRSVRNEEIQAGELRRNFDALIFPDQTAESIAAGYRSGEAPPEYTGGLGGKGAEALKRFAVEGGALLFLNRSAGYAVATLELRVRDALRGLSRNDFYSPGSLLEVSLEGGPLCYGLPGAIAVWSESSPAWDIPKGSPARVVARYPKADVLASGWLIGERRIADKAALVDYPLGAGRVVLFGFRPQYRGQSYRTSKLLFNALLGR